MAKIKLITEEQIKNLQDNYNVTGTQASINSGQCWLMEGSQGRFAMSMLESGVCMLPVIRRRDYYGSIVPSRNDIAIGTKGSLQNAQVFWQNVIDGDSATIVALEECFGIAEEKEN